MRLGSKVESSQPPRARRGAPKGMANQVPAYGCPCIHDSRRLMGVPKVRGAREGELDLASYLAAKPSRRRFMNGSAFSARLRQRSACSFKNELSTFDSNATSQLGAACLAASSAPGLFRLSFPSFLRLQPELDQAADGF
jgi:hypothetical protein